MQLELQKRCVGEPRRFQGDEAVHQTYRLCAPLAWAEPGLKARQLGRRVDFKIDWSKTDSIIIHLGTSEVFKASSLRPMPPKLSTAANVNQSFSCAGGSAEALAAEAPFCLKDWKKLRKKLSDVGPVMFSFRSHQ